uniref:Reverse transcriptase Ty1/copia-type domain-containing protein n=1 Tax=Tanacetum cinerariifolium TaxID=118510 RepID=A0A6L2NNL6_TANCI|nr:hypothetical protein [Tanacetum cinerariifolium]
MASKQFSLEPVFSNLNETGKSSNPLVSQVSETSKKDLEDLFHNFYDEYFGSSKILKSSTTNVETSNDEIPSHEEEVFHEKEVYVSQPPGFVSKQYPDHVYALDKALYGLKQAPRAWYDVLLQFLIESGFQKVPTPMVEQAKLKLDLVGKPFDHTDYQSMIGSLMYDTSSRPNIMFSTCICARYQENPNEHHVSAVKRIFRYLKGCINLGLWYSKDSGFDLTAYSEADHAGCHLDRKSTSGSVQFLGDKLIQVAQKKVKMAFENVDSSLRVQLIPSKIKYANKVILNFHKEFSVFSSFNEKGNDGLFQNNMFKNKKELVSKIPNEKSFQVVI